MSKVAVPSLGCSHVHFGLAYTILYNCALVAAAAVSCCAAAAVAVVVLLLCCCRWLLFLLLLLWCDFCSHNSMDQQ